VGALVKDYKGDAAAVAGETFDTSPVNLDARSQRFTLQTSMKVVLLPKKTRGGAVNFALDLHYADEKSAFGKQTVGAMTGSMMLRGTSKRDRQQIEDALDQLRAKVDVHGGVTGTSVSGQTFNKELP